MFFDNLDNLVRVLIVGVLAYAALVLILRTSGKRTLSGLNAFDFIVTVALGSTLATILLSADVALAEGILALVLLVGLQMLVAWTSVRSRALRRVVKSEPRALVRDGQLDEEALRDERVTVEEIRQALRQSGAGGLGQVSSVVLETDGTVSVIRAESYGDGWALENVR